MQRYPTSPSTMRREFQSQNLQSLEISASILLKKQAVKIHNSMIINWVTENITLCVPAIRAGTRTRPRTIVMELYKSLYPYMFPVDSGFTTASVIVAGGFKRETMAT
jgi:hypothetical protein